MSIETYSLCNLEYKNGIHGATFTTPTNSKKNLLKFYIFEVSDIHPLHYQLPQWVIFMVGNRTLE